MDKFVFNNISKSFNLILVLNEWILFIVTIILPRSQLISNKKYILDFNLNRLIFLWINRGLSDRWFFLPIFFELYHQFVDNQFLLRLLFSSIDQGILLLLNTIILLLFFEAQTLLLLLRWLLLILLFDALFFIIIKEVIIVLLVNEFWFWNSIRWYIRRLLFWHFWFINLSFRIIIGFSHHLPVNIYRIHVLRLCNKWILMFGLHNTESKNVERGFGLGIDIWNHWLVHPSIPSDYRWRGISSHIYIFLLFNHLLFHQRLFSCTWPHSFDWICTRINHFKLVFILVRC